MNFRHAFILIGLCALVVGSLTQDADYADEVEQKPAPRPSILRRPIIGARGKAATTTTTTTPAPKEADPANDASEDEVIYDDEEGQEEPTTTQASRKLKSGVVRPFRSNDDLLAALKRRRQEAASGKTHHQEATSAPSERSENPVESSAKSSAGRRRFNTATKSEPNSAPVDEAPAAKKPNRNRFNARGFKAAPENAEIAGLETNQQAVEVKPRAGFKPGQRRF